MDTTSATITTSTTATTDGDCPACRLSGHTAEEARRIAPTYMAIVDDPAPRPSREVAVPDEPAAECWTCRRLRYDGFDPVALRAADVRRDGLSLGAAKRTVLYLLREAGVVDSRGAIVTSRPAPRGRLDVAIRALTDHGFEPAVAVGDDLVTVAVDCRSCPEDATPEEREALASQLAQRVRADVSHAYAHEGVVAASARAEREADHEWQWCMEQTIACLRSRSAS